MNRTLSAVPTRLRDLATEVDAALVAETRRDIALLQRAERDIRAALVDIVDPMQFAGLEADGVGLLYDLLAVAEAYHLGADDLATASLPLVIVDALIRRHARGER